MRPTVLARRSRFASSSRSKSTVVVGADGSAVTHGAGTCGTLTLRNVMAILFRYVVGRTSAWLEARGGVWLEDGAGSWIFGYSPILSDGHKWRTARRGAHPDDLFCGAQGTTTARKKDLWSALA